MKNKILFWGLVSLFIVGACNSPQPVEEAPAESDTTAVVDSAQTE
jgi:hypothetical protein